MPETLAFLACNRACNRAASSVQAFPYSDAAAAEGLLCEGGSTSNNQTGPNNQTEITPNRE